MNASNDDIRFKRLLHRIDPGSLLLGSWSLTGGVSAQVTALETVCSNGRPRRLVARRHGAADRKRCPQIASHEFTLLQCLHTAGLATPRPVFLDESGEIFADPVLVLEYIEGAPGFAPSPGTDPLDSFVMHLARIHLLDCTRLEVPFLPKQFERVVGKLHTGWEGTEAETKEERQILQGLRSVWPTLVQRNSPALLHGDYWPGNTLWKSGELVAVIDWEDAAIGDPLADLANSRLEILWALGDDAMERFTQRYRSLIPQLDISDLAFWDLGAALRPARNMGSWRLDIPTERTMRASLQRFVQQALARLPTP